jgi:hypothetical protein
MKHDFFTLLGLAIICLTLWLCCRTICRTYLVIAAGQASNAFDETNDK